MRYASCEILVGRTRIEYAATLGSDAGGGDAIILSATSLFSRSLQ
jgi:hypothetical protein